MTNGAGLGREGADETNAAALAVVRSSDALRVKMLRQLVDVADEATFIADGALSLTGWLRRQAGMAEREARSTARRVGVLRRLPGFADLLFSGETTIGHLDALAEVATERRQETFDLYGDKLIEAAATTGVDWFAKGCRHFGALADEHLCEPSAPRSAGSLSFVSTLFGEAELSGRLTTDQATVVGEAFDQLCDPDPNNAPVRRTLTERRADALADLAASFLGGATSDGATTTRRPINPATIVVGLNELTGNDDDISLTEIRWELLVGGPIPSRLADHLTCDASIRRLVVDPAGNPLNLGRSTAVVSHSQRHALAIRDGGCVFPTCDRPPTWADAHHIEHWAHHGETDLDNLILLCRHHHRLVHGIEWYIARDPVTGTVVATRSDGRRYTRPGPGRPPTARDGPNGTDPPI
ncbi:MAG: hypothetical protein ACI91O_001496 [Candidatus Poriferisodalaceae bacterium]|jgi:hypothetical protein